MRYLHKGGIVSEDYAGFKHGECLGCKKVRNLDNRGLCMGAYSNPCSDLIPSHIPSEQYSKYRDRVILGKLPNN
jgi:hypothetical protein